MVLRFSEGGKENLCAQSLGTYNCNNLHLVSQSILKIEELNACDTQLLGCGANHRDDGSNSQVSKPFICLQGLIAGVNAARRAQQMTSVTLPRNSSYIGTLLDAMVTKVG